VPRWRRAVVAGAYVVAGIGVAAATFWAVAKVTPAPKLQPIRLAIVTPVAQPLSVGQADRSLDVSPDGTHVVYVTPTGQLMVRAIDQLEAEPLRGITGARAPFFSPDGQWIGFFQGSTDLRKVSVRGGPAITLCRTGSAPRRASWGSDDTIVFATSASTTGLFSVPAGGGDPKVLTKPDAARGEQDHCVERVLSAGRRDGNSGAPDDERQRSVHSINVSRWNRDRGARSDLALIHVGKPASEPLVQTKFSETHPEISPDGHWLAYTSTESGKGEVYVRPFPNVNGGKWQISTADGQRPAWARSGKELFYGTRLGSIMAVVVQAGSSFSHGNPVKLFDWKTLGTPGLARTYDVSRDGQRFLMIKEAGDDNASASSHIVVVLNWTEELKAKLPAK